MAGLLRQERSIFVLVALGNRAPACARTVADDRAAPEVTARTERQLAIAD